MQRLEVQFKLIVVALVSRKKRGSLTQSDMTLKMKFDFGIIWTDASNLIAIKVSIIIVTSLCE